MSVLIQGMTGKEGRRMAAWMIASGTDVVAGVTPGKTGEQVEGRPIFDSVADAKKRFPEIDTTSIVVPPLRVMEATEQAIASGITYVHILSEGVPVHDVLRIRRLAKEKGVTILGPSSVGMMMPREKWRVGYIGGEHPFEGAIVGSIGLVSTSGGMSNEILKMFFRNGIGVHCAMAVGGDRIPGMTAEEAIEAWMKMDEIKLVAAFVEPGNPLLDRLVTGQVRFAKPCVFLVPGDALADLPKGRPYGHAGTQLAEHAPTLHDMRKAITDYGYPCFARMEDFIEAIKSL
jgi:succinyl-CoA synthetase alpha subunit